MRSKKPKPDIRKQLFYWFSDWFGLFIRVPKKSLKDEAYFVYEVVSAWIWSEPEAVTELLYLKIDPCLDNETLVTLIAALSSEYVTI